ncbi:hypothetical protein AW878_19685 [Bordetella pseudohinzii]|uniref:TRAP-type mannitol/chloroaromatic compound transport system, periplasmic component n=1 Tax=Bordetella pseudohinzii TaxID=1331258 RepID=A0ABM6DBC7_9BORD|nr:hypothetical protein BBN53_03710 [Bordetella pseudohinzii]KMM26113.1 hypothetical protein L540_16410 [Bordetella pseudohinzii]KXA75660.1 hypothetical protein AW878_19685 [Bordetella pseudohinzii]KXA82843.1 hypothetical protein AW877_01780 [Bordetella pseudohinzii]
MLRSAMDVGARSLPARRALALACGMALGAAQIGAQAVGAPIELGVADYRSYLPETHSLRMALHAFARQVETNSGGRLHVRVWPGAPAGSPQDQIQALRTAAPGAPDIMVVAATGLAGLSPDFELFDLPYALRDDASVDAIFDGGVGQRLLASLAPAGLVGLGWMENGFRQLSSSQARIQGLADFKGLAVRTLPTAVSTQAFSAWGARPVSLPASGVHAALRSGTVQAQEGFVTQLLDSRLYEVQRHVWLTNHSFGAQVLVMNAAAWRGLSEADARALKEAAIAASREQRAGSRAEARQALAELSSRGMQVHRMPPRTLEDLADATADVRRRHPAFLQLGSSPVSRLMQNPQ